MALLDEQIVEEWLNSRNFFTIRGIKYGNNREADLLACRLQDNKVECWHVEVHVSYEPVSYISKSIDSSEKNNAKKSKTSSAKTRTLSELEKNAEEWVDTKFKNRDIQLKRKTFVSDVEWKYKLVHAKVRHPKELELIKSNGIELIPYDTVVSDLMSNSNQKEKYKSSSSASNIISLLNYMKEKK
jgi:hypothetical protein